VRRTLPGIAPELLRSRSWVWMLMLLELVNPT